MLAFRLYILFRRDRSLRKYLVTALKQIVEGKYPKFMEPLAARQLNIVSSMRIPKVCKGSQRPKVVRDSASILAYPIQYKFGAFFLNSSITCESSEHLENDRNPVLVF